MDKKIQKILEEKIQESMKKRNEITSLVKSLENIEDSKKFIKEGKSSLYTKANKMKEFGANTKTEILNNQE